MAEVIVEESVPATESGAHKALRSERALRKDAERNLAMVRGDLVARVARLEQRGLTPVLDAMAEWRRDQAAEVAQVRAELRELADAFEQLRGMLAQP